MLSEKVGYKEIGKNNYNTSAHANSNYIYFCSYKAQRLLPLMLIQLRLSNSCKFWIGNILILPGTPSNCKENKIGKKGTGKSGNADYEEIPATASDYTSLKFEAGKETVYAELSTKPTNKL